MSADPSRYEWKEEENNYGIVSYAFGTSSEFFTGTGTSPAFTPTPISPDFYSLQSQWYVEIQWPAYIMLTIQGTHSPQPGLLQQITLQLTANILARRALTVGMLRQQLLFQPSKT